METGIKKGRERFVISQLAAWTSAGLALGSVQLVYLSGVLVPAHVASGYSAMVLLRMGLGIAILAILISPVSVWLCLRVPVSQRFPLLYIMIVGAVAAFLIAAGTICYIVWPMVTAK